MPFRSRTRCILNGVYIYVQLNYHESGRKKSPAVPVSPKGCRIYKNTQNPGSTILDCGGRAAATRLSGMVDPVARRVDLPAPGALEPGRGWGARIHSGARKRRGTSLPVANQDAAHSNVKRRGEVRVPPAWGSWGHRQNAHALPYMGIVFGKPL